MIDSIDDVSSATGAVLRKRCSRDQEKWSTLAFFEENKLVLMKFNNDQVHNQSDVRQVDYLDENQNYNIEKKIIDLNHNQSITCGSIKYFSDFSDTYYNIFRVKHTFKNECWELAATGDEETPLEKYYRLKFETEELLQEISSQKENENDKDKKLCTNIEFQTKNLFEKLSNYNIDGFSEQFDDLRISDTCNFENCIINPLLNKVLHSDGKECVLNNISQIKNIKTIPRPKKMKINQLLQISKLEECLQKLVTIIGFEKSVLKHLGDSNNSGLLEDVVLLQKLSKLNLPQVNVIESRSTDLLAKLKQITTSFNYQNLETDSKINQLYEFILKARRESHLLSNVIQRMTMLEIIYHKVELFTVTINNLKAQYSETSKILKNNEKLLIKIMTHISDNVENIFFNLNSLNARIEVIVDKLKNEE